LKSIYFAIHLEENYHFMKRRQAIRQIAVVSSGFVLLPSCDFQSGTKTFKTYKHLPLGKEQYQIIEALQAAILPTEKMPVSATETPIDYMLTRLNDCYSMDDIGKYLDGLKDFQESIKSKFNKSFEQLNLEEQTQVLNGGFEDEKNSSAKDFLEMNKRLTVEYFTQSEDYQVNHFGYEFIPSRYSGCVNISE